MADQTPDQDRPWRLLSLVPLPPESIQGLLGDLPIEVFAPAELTTAAVTIAIADADLLLGSWAGTVPVTRELLAAAPRLRAIQQPSVGVDSIDVEACTTAGVVVANAAGFNTDSVAEWCLAATLASLRLLVSADSEIRAGGWPQLELAGRGSRELRDAKIGIIGFGAIGQACARLFTGLGCEVGQWSRRQRDEEPWYELSDLVERSDVLIVVIALADQTRGLLSAELLASMPRDAVLINASRGGVVDESAVAELIRSGALAAAAFDVFDAEPLPADSPLRGDPRILLSPHAAGSTRQSQGRLFTTIRDNLGRAVSGVPMEHLVNDLEPVLHRHS